MKFRLVFAFLVTSVLASPCMAQSRANPGPLSDNGGQPPAALGRKKDKAQADQNAAQSGANNQAQSAGRRTMPQQQAPQNPSQNGKKKKKNKGGDE